MSTRIDPEGGEIAGDSLFPVSNFRVRIGDDPISFRRVSALGVQVEGGDETSGGPTVTLQRALTESRLLYDWSMAAARGEADARDVVIEQLDQDGEPTGVAWGLAGAMPVAWHSPEWDALTDAVAEETIELRYRELRRL